MLPGHFLGPLLSRLAFSYFQAPSPKTLLNALRSLSVEAARSLARVMAHLHSLGLLVQGPSTPSGGFSVVTMTEPGKCPGLFVSSDSFSSTRSCSRGCVGRNIILPKACLSALWGQKQPLGAPQLSGTKVLVFSQRTTYPSHLRFCFRLLRFFLVEEG